MTFHCSIPFKMDQGPKERVAAAFMEIDLLLSIPTDKGTAVRKFYRFDPYYGSDCERDLLCRINHVLGLGAGRFGLTYAELSER